MNLFYSFEVLLVGLLIVTGLIYRLVPTIWQNQNYSLVALLIGVVQLIVVGLREEEPLAPILAFLLIGLGALLPDLARALSAWVRRPRFITIILRAMVIGVVIYTVAFRLDLVSSIVGPILLIVILWYGFLTVIGRGPFARRGR